MASTVGGSRTYWLDEDAAAEPPQFDRNYKGTADLRASLSRRSSRNIDRLSSQAAPASSKRKRTSTEDDNEEMETDADAAPASAKLQRTTQTVGKVSGRPWRQFQAAPARASSQKSKQATALTWEQRMEQKASKKMFQERRKEIEDARRSVKRAAKEQRESARERKEENERRSRVVQVVTNPASLKRIMGNKKLKKKLVKV